MTRRAGTILSLLDILGSTVTWTAGVRGFVSIPNSQDTTGKIAVQNHSGDRHPSTVARFRGPRVKVIEP